MREQETRSCSVDTPLAPLPTTPALGPQSAHSPVRKPVTFSFIGLIGGLFGGLLGIGGGSAIAPLLLLTGALGPAEIAGTTLAVVLIISTVGSAGYASLGLLDLGLAWPIAMGSIVGSVLGALLAKRVSVPLMTFIFLLILPYFAVKEFWPAFAAPDIATNLSTLVLLGLITGFFSGMLGISGASLVVPSLVGFFLIEHHAAQGIAISVALADSTAGVITHAHQRNIRYRMLLRLAVPAAVAAIVGVYLSDWLSIDVLRNLFGTFMAVVWVMMLARSLKSFGSERGALLASLARSITPKAVGGRHLNSFHHPPGGRWVDVARSHMPRKACVNIKQLMTVMLVFLPLAVASEFLHFGPLFTFTCSAIACVPLSYWLGEATGNLGDRLGPVAGGLLNATFGNAAEFIISIMALNQGLLIVVRTSLIGSVVGQLLLVLGTSLLMAGLKYRDLGFSRSLVQINFTLMVLAMVAIGLPSVLLLVAPDEAEASGSILAPALSVLLLIIYGFAVAFSLQHQPEEGESDGPRWSIPKGLVILGVSTGSIVFASELLVGSILPFIETTGISAVFIGLILIPIFSNVVDHIVAISMALKNRMDLSLTISVGSAAQVACMVLPAIVLLSMFMGQPLGLIFTPVELLPLGVGLLLMIPVLLDGRSNWLEGAQLLTCYLVLAVVLWSV